VLALVGGEPSLIIPGRAVKGVDTTGAGDCFVGALAAQLAAGRDSRCARLRQHRRSICVQRMGAAPSMPTAADYFSAAYFSIPVRGSHSVSSGSA
jgi:ribokinase